MGIVAAAEAATTKSSSSSLTFPILIVLVFVGFYFLMIRPQRRRQQQVAQQQKTIAPGSLVRTTAGMYATVVSVEDNDVILEVAPGVEVRYLKRAIAEVVTPAEQAFEDDESFESADDAFEDDEPATDDEAPGTQDTVNGVGSDEMAKADKDNVH